MKAGLTMMFAASLFTACQDDDSVETVNRNKPQVSLDRTSETITEGDEITFTMTTNRVSTRPMTFKVEVVGEESTSVFRDFTTSGTETDLTGDGGWGQGQIGYLIEFPAMAETATFTLTALNDFNVEQTETLKLRFRSAEDGNGSVAPESEFITITINENASNDVALRLDWSMSTTDAFGTIHPGIYQSGDSEEAYSGYDFDLYIFDESFSVEVSEGAGATGNPLEEVTLDSTLPDGNYFVIVDLFDSGAAPDTPFVFDIKLEATKSGTWATTIPVEGFDSAYPVSAPGGLGAGYKIVAVIEKTGTTYVVKNYETDEVLASGRRAQLQNLVLNKRLGRK